MKAAVEIVYADGTKRAVDIELGRPRVKGPRLLDMIDKRVNDRRDLGQWERWNLLAISE